MKDGKMDYDSSVKIINDHVPDAAKAHALAALDKCHMVGDGLDPCEAAYAIVQCICKEDKGFKLTF